MKSDSITIKDIAKALNISHSSVARALKGSHKISELTIQKVKEYAAKNNYRPNLMAQSLKNKQSRSIGVMLCSIPNNFFAEVINGIESVAAGTDYHVMISQSHESYEKEIKNLQNFEWKAVDGLLVSISTETQDLSHFEALIKKGIPVVFFDRVPDITNAYKIVADDSGGCFALVEHLITSGYKKIAHITSSPQLSITRLRLEGYAKALSKKGLKIREDYIKYCQHGGRDEEEVEIAVNQLLKLKDPPDAIVTASDRITIKTFALLKNKGIKIPEEISISGFSNFSAPELFCPSLTTVVQPAFEMGKQAAELLLKLVEKKKVDKEFKIVLPTELIIRESTRKKG